MAESLNDEVTALVILVMIAVAATAGIHLGDILALQIPSAGSTVLAMALVATVVEYHCMI